MSIRLLAALAAFLVTLPAGAEPRTVTDAAGRAVTIADASRIVSVGGTVTEILYALGAGDRIVAADLTSTYPAAAAAKPSVGYMRALSAEGVLAMAPSLVLAIEDAGPVQAIDVLEQASVPFVLVPKAGDGDGVADTIRLIGRAIGEEAKAEALAAAVGADIAAIEAATHSIPARRKAVFILGVSTGAPLVGGDNTAADDMFALAGVDNALAYVDGYKPASDEAAVAAAPDVLVLMAERSHDLGDDAILSLPAFAGTPAARDRRLIRMSGAYLLNFGPRTAHAARDLARAVYPDLPLPDLPERPWAVGAAAPGG